MAVRGNKASATLDTSRSRLVGARDERPARPRPRRGGSTRSSRRRAPMRRHGAAARSSMNGRRRRSASWRAMASRMSFGCRRARSTARRSSTLGATRRARGSRRRGRRRPPAAAVLQLISQPKSRDRPGRCIRRRRAAAPHRRAHRRCPWAARGGWATLDHGAADVVGVQAIRLELASVARAAEERDSPARPIARSRSSGVVRAEQGVRQSVAQAHPRRAVREQAVARSAARASTGDEVDAEGATAGRCPRKPRYEPR